MKATSRSPDAIWRERDAPPSPAADPVYAQEAAGRAMSGRVKLERDISEIKIAFRVPPEYPTPNFPWSWNVAPTDNLPIVRYNAKPGHPTLELMRWGLAKDI